MITAYLLIVAAALLLAGKKRRKLFVILMLLIVSNLFVWNEALKYPPHATRVTFFDTGKADAFLIESAGGGVVLIDGGCSGKADKEGDGKRIIEPYLRQRGIRKIDLMILTHAHDDHMGGLLHIAENFGIGCFIEGRVNTIDKEDREPYRNLMKILGKSNIRHLMVKRGDIISGIDGMKFYVLNPPGRLPYNDPNNDSVVIKAVMDNGMSILFCADAETAAVRDILCFGSFLDSEIVKMPHHGGEIAPICILRQFLDFTNPDKVIITNLSKEKINKKTIQELEKKRIKTHITGTSSAKTIRIVRKNKPK